MAFTRNTIEIRLVVNGTLVHTLVLPKVHLIAAKVSLREVDSDTGNGGVPEWVRVNWLGWIGIEKKDNVYEVLCSKLRWSGVVEWLDPEQLFSY